MQTKNTISTNRKSESQNYHGFTLVELIVVITILVILGTIAFVSLGGFSGNARDGSRVSDLANLSKGLDIISVKTGSYPSPDSAFSVTYSGGTVWYQWTVGDSVINMISANGAKISKKPIDPLKTTKEYTYSKLAYGNGYQLKSDWEGDTIAYLPSSSGLTRGSNLAESRFVPNGSFDWIPAFAGMTNIGFEQAHAASGNPTLTYIKGTYNGMVAKTQTGNTVYLLAVPSIITSNNGSSDITLLSNTFLIHGQTNSWGVSYATNTPKLLVFSSGALPSTDAERILFASGLALAYSGTALASQTNIQPFITALASGNTTTLASLGGGMATSVGGSASTTTGGGGTTPTSLCGASNGQTVASNGFSGSLCAAGSNVISYSGKGGTSTGNTLSWTCQDASSATGSCSATYGKPTTGTGGQSCDTYDQLIGSLTGSYSVWSMCNMGAYTAYTNQTITSCGWGTSDCDSSVRYAIGSYYQWGRNKDVTVGSTTAGPLASDSTNNFIMGVTASVDWINPQNSNLWGWSGTTDTSGTFLSQGSPAAMQWPCPTGYHVPTQLEWCASIRSITPGLACTTAFQNGASVLNTLKIPLAGYRYNIDATYWEQGTFGIYATSSPDSTYARYIWFLPDLIEPLNGNYRAMGSSVRCLKN